MQYPNCRCSKLNQYTFNLNKVTLCYNNERLMAKWVGGNWYYYIKLNWNHSLKLALDGIDLNNFTLNSPIVIIHYNDDLKGWSQINEIELIILNWSILPIIVNYIISNAEEEVS